MTTNRSQWLRWTALVLGVCVLGGVLAVTAAPWLLEVESSLPCVRRDQHPELVEVHFTPGLQEHQSWITFRGIDADATFVELCLDGMQVAVAPHTLENGIVQYNIRTTFVDALWVIGRLDDYRRPDHWQLYWYSCGTKPNDPTGCY
ncbi:MAG: hypothetical protein NVSMB2_16440 [Chloroflexota bacterium]